MSRIGALAETLLMLGKILDPMPDDDRRLVLGWLATAYESEEPETKPKPAKSKPPPTPIPFSGRG